MGGYQTDSGRKVQSSHKNLEIIFKISFLQGQSKVRQIVRQTQMRLGQETLVVVQDQLHHQEVDHRVVQRILEVDPDPGKIYL